MGTHPADDRHVTISSAADPEAITEKGNCCSISKGALGILSTATSAIGAAPLTSYAPTFWTKACNRNTVDPASRTKINKATATMTFSTADRLIPLSRPAAAESVAIAVITAMSAT